MSDYPDRLGLMKDEEDYVLVRMANDIADGAFLAYAAVYDLIYDTGCTNLKTDTCPIS